MELARNDRCGVVYGGGDGRRVGHKRKLTGEVLTQGKARCAGRTSLRGICVDGASGQLFSAAGNGKDHPVA